MLAHSYVERVTAALAMRGSVDGISASLFTGFLIVVAVEAVAIRAVDPEQGNFLSAAYAVGHLTLAIPAVLLSAPTIVLFFHACMVDGRPVGICEGASAVHAREGYVGWLLQTSSTDFIIVEILISKIKAWMFCVTVSATYKLGTFEAFEGLGNKLPCMWIIEVFPFQFLLKIVHQRQPAIITWTAFRSVESFAILKGLKKGLFEGG